jgi:hypothetical protein
MVSGQLTPRHEIAHALTGGSMCGGYPTHSDGGGLSERHCSSVGATVATLIVGADLWEPTSAPGVRKQVLLFNIATVLTVVIGVLVLYAALYVLALVAAFWFVVPQVFTSAVGHPASLRDFFELAWLTCFLAMIGGALGAALETDDAVRDAAYVRRFDAQTRTGGTI